MFKIAALKKLAKEKMRESGKKHNCSLSYMISIAMIFGYKNLNTVESKW